VVGKKLEVIQLGLRGRQSFEVQFRGIVGKGFAINDLAGFSPIGRKYLKRLAGPVFGFPGFLKKTGIKGLGFDAGLIESLFDLYLGLDSGRIISPAIVDLLCSILVGQVRNDFLCLALEEEELAS
jgi:hypothetical protein